MSARRAVALGVLASVLAAAPAASQEPAPIGKDAVLALEYPPLDFEPPIPEVHTLPGGVQVFYMEDRSLPLVTLLARFEGGYGRFPRDYFAAGLALPTLLRSGGTRTLSSDSVDLLVEHHALQLTFGSAGGSVTSTVNALRSTLPDAVRLWGDMLKHPRFDSTRAEVWRGQELESVLRRRDDPGRIAIGTFNRLVYGGHPVGWEMSAADLEPEDLSAERVGWLHSRILCPDNLILGVTGDVSWAEAEPYLVELVADWPPCPEPLPDIPLPELRQEGGIFLVPRPFEQSTIVLAHASDVRQGDGDAFFASRIGNSILGAGGFSSRLMTELRTNRGLAYSASSLWTTPNESQGLVGALTQTSAGTTVAAIRVVLDVLQGMRSAAPTDAEVRIAVDEAVNGFVFNFESARQIVFRQMLYRAEGLPVDWLESYLEELQEVEPADVLEVFREEVRPEDLVILVVGDPERFAEPLDALGAVTVLEPEPAAPTPPAPPPSAGPRSPG